MLKTNKSESISQSIPERREPDRMPEYRERKPTSKGLLARVKCQKRNARTSAILSVSLKTRESVSLQKSCYVAGSITSQSFPDFLNLSESCQKKAVLVQRHNTSLHSKFRQTALKLTPKGLDYTQIDTRITDLWFWEVLGQSQSWLRTMQTDLWKLYINSRIFEFLTPCSKNQTLAHAQKRDCVPLMNSKYMDISCCLYSVFMLIWWLRDWGSRIWRPAVSGLVFCNLAPHTHAANIKF